MGAKQRYRVMLGRIRVRYWRPAVAISVAIHAAAIAWLTVRAPAHAHELNPTAAPVTPIEIVTRPAEPREPVDVVLLDEEAIARRVASSSASSASSASSTA